MVTWQRTRALTQYASKFKRYFDTVPLRYLLQTDTPRVAQHETPIRLTFFFPTVSARDRLSIQRGEVRGGVPRSQKREENPRAGLVKNHERRRGAGGDHGEPLHRAGTAMWGFPKSDTHCFISNAPVTVQTDYPSLLSINRPTHRPIQ